jgi:hypothetical protein
MWDGCHEVRPSFCAWFAPFPMIYLNPKAGGLTPHPPYVPVRPFPNDLPQTQGGRAYATPTLRSRSPLHPTIYLSSKAGELMLFLLGEVRRRCRVVGRRLEIAFPWGNTLSGEPGELTNS